VPQKLILEQILKNHPMNTPEVKSIVLEKPLTAAGKIFTGDYAKSPDYINEVKRGLEKAGISFDQYKVMGVYYDNPQEKKAEELKSFQGVFLQNGNTEVPSSFEKLNLKGNVLYVRMTGGDIMKAIYDGYGALFNHIQKNALTLKSNAGYQVTTFENGTMTTEIYMELA
jgi:hypothetical protein